MPEQMGRLIMQHFISGLFHHANILSNNIPLECHDIIPEVIALLTGIKRIVVLSIRKAISPEVADIRAICIDGLAFKDN